MVSFNDALHVLAWRSSRAFFHHFENSKYLFCTVKGIPPAANIVKNSHWDVSFQLTHRVRRELSSMCIFH